MNSKMTALKPLFRPTMALMVGCVASLNGALHAEFDSPVSIDSIRATTDAGIGKARAHDQTTDADSGSWSGASRMSRRITLSEATNDISFDADLIAGAVSASSHTRGTRTSAKSSTMIEFSIDRPDQSRPEASWGWSLPSPLESLMGGAPPACRAVLECSVRRSGILGDVKGSMSRPGWGGPRSGRVIGLTLSRNGVVIADCLVGINEFVASRDIEIELDLRPGDYVLRVECGFELSTGFPRASAASGSVDYSLEFSAYGPGTAQADLVTSNESFDLEAGSTGAPWSWGSIDSDEWRYRQVSERDDIASAGGVVGIGTGGFHGFQFTQARRSGTSMHERAQSVNVKDMLFELPVQSDVGISTLFNFRNESPIREVNDSMSSLVITRDATGEEVFRIDVDSDHVDPHTFFGRNEQWVNLEADFYRMTLTTRSSCGIHFEDSGTEVGFWFALVFMTP